MLRYSIVIAWRFAASPLTCVARGRRICGALHLFVYGMAPVQYFICRASGIRRSFAQAREHRRFYWFVVGSPLIAPPIRYTRKLCSLMAARMKRFVLALVACIADRQCSKQPQ
jgi:hypothetical protein